MRLIRHKRKLQQVQVHFLPSVSYHVSYTALLTLVAVTFLTSTLTARTYRWLLGMVGYGTTVVVVKKHGTKLPLCKERFIKNHLQLFFTVYFTCATPAPQVLRSTFSSSVTPHSSCIRRHYVVIINSGKNFLSLRTLKALHLLAEVAVAKAAVAVEVAVAVAAVTITVAQQNSA